MIKWISIVFIITYSCLLSYGQMDNYSYLQPIDGVTEEWHKVVLPDNVYESIQKDYADIRIYGITSDGDTIEAPYILSNSKDKITKDQVSYSRINNSKNENGYYTTFKLDDVLPINNIDLDFKTKNYDWKVELAGSMDQKEWFTILADYRIVGIKNAETDFQYSKLSFSDASYKYYRLLVPSDIDPGLNTASISKHKIQAGTYKKLPLQNWAVSNDAKSKNTEVKISLPKALPASQISIKVNDNFDYYRPLKIRYLRDSFETDKGWKYRYETLSATTLTSLGESTYDFNSIITKQMQLVISNADNQPLDISDIRVSGFVHELAIRFTEPADYYLTYGNNTARTPRYDITRFADKIPAELKTLTLGTVKDIRNTPAEANPLLQSKLWLWLAMGLAIAIMGWFTLSMMRDKK